jgi:hypothetical protein
MCLGPLRAFGSPSPRPRAGWGRDRYKTHFTGVTCHPKARLPAFSNACSRVVLSSQDARNCGRFRPDSTHARRLRLQGKGSMHLAITPARETRLLLARPPPHLCNVQARQSDTQVVLSPYGDVFRPSTRAPPPALPFEKTARETRASSHLPLPIDANCLHPLSSSFPARSLEFPRVPRRRGFAFHDANPRFRSPVALSGGVLARAAVQRISIPIERASDALSQTRFQNKR